MGRKLCRLLSFIAGASVVMEKNVESSLDTAIWLTFGSPVEDMGKPVEKRTEGEGGGGAAFLGIPRNKVHSG